MKISKNKKKHINKHSDKREIFAHIKELWNFNHIHHILSRNEQPIKHLTHLKPVFSPHPF